jgi:hypothetical protein
MYDVLYLDDGRRSTVLAAGLHSDAAADVAREEAKRRHAARMFGSGSEPPCQGRIVLIVETDSTKLARR